MAARKAGFFPEINEEHSSSDHNSHSPLAKIIQDLKRKDGVTAAASSGSKIALLDSSDPWGTVELSSEEPRSAVEPPTTPNASCSCQSRVRRRASWMDLDHSRKNSFAYSPSSPRRLPRGARPILRGESSALSESNENDGSLSNCPDCGRKISDYNTEVKTEQPSRTPRQMRLNEWLDSSRKECFGSPEHARALLSATPRLRIISQASTDMHGAGELSSKGILGFMLPVSAPNGANPNENGGKKDYQASLVRLRANQQAAAELSSLLWTLAHEMSLEDYGSVENEVFKAVFALVHSQDGSRRMAGLCALDALIDAPSSDEEKKAVKFANTLSNSLRTAHGDYEFLSTVSKALGHMATRTVNIDFVETEIVRALEWLRTDHSDRR